MLAVKAPAKGPATQIHIYVVSFILPLNISNAVSEIAIPGLRQPKNIIDISNSIPPLWVVYPLEI